MTSEHEMIKWYVDTMLVLLYLRNGAFIIKTHDVLYSKKGREPHKKSYEGEDVLKGQAIVYLYNNACN